MISRRVKKPDLCDWKQTLCLGVVNCYLPECNKGYCCLATAITHGCHTTPATPTRREVICCVSLLPGTRRRAAGTSLSSSGVAGTDGRDGLAGDRGSSHSLTTEAWKQILLQGGGKNHRSAIGLKPVRATGYGEGFGPGIERRSRAVRWGHARNLHSVLCVWRKRSNNINNNNNNEKPSLGFGHNNQDVTLMSAY